MNALALLDAVRALLEGELDYPWSLGYAPDRAPRYGVITAPPWGAGESSVAGPGMSVDVDFRVKAVTGTVLGVGNMLSKVRTVLWPNQHPSRPPIPGWSVEVVYVRSEFVDVDTSASRTASNRYPAFGVDTYRLVAEPDGSVPVVVESGSDGASVNHPAASTWTIPHTLGRIPVVAVYVDGHEVLADVSATDLAVTVTFPTPTAGTAVLT